MIIESLMVDSTEQFSREVSGARDIEVSGARDIFLRTRVINDARLLSAEQIRSLIAPTRSELWRETVTGIRSKIGEIRDFFTSQNRQNDPLMSLRERDI